MTFKEKQLNILIADDDEDDVVLVKELIREGVFEASCQFTHVVNGMEVLETLSSSPMDICLLDYRLGGDNGIDILVELRESGIKVPVILLTGQGDQEVAVSAMKGGATDYIVKGNLNSQNFANSIRNAIKITAEEEQRKKAEMTLRIQGNLLRGISEAASRLLTVHDHEPAVAEALAILGRAAEVDFVHIFQDHSESNSDEVNFRLKYAWAKASKLAETDSDFLHISNSDVDFVNWAKGLSEGKTINGSIPSFPKPVGQLFSKKGARSMIFLPIVIDFVYWGFVVFSDCQRERTWSEDEKTVFNTAVAIIGGEIKRNRDGQAFRSIVEGTSSQTGDKFFRSLVRNLASALPAKSAIICEIIDYSKGICRLMAGWDGERFIKGKNYSAVDSPCEDVLAGMASFYPDRVKDLFLPDKGLSEIRARSYAGVPFFDSNTKIIGHLSVADDNPMVDKKRTISILRVFAARAGAELERKRAEETIKSMAYYDSLTGLPNRILLHDRLSLALAQADRKKSMLAVLYLDCDFFKKINDTLGHSAGDLLLQKLAERFISCLREGDTVARLGGDEFILLLPEIHNSKDAEIIAQKLIKVAKPPMDLDGDEVSITLSLGIAVYPDDGTNANMLIKNADDALYAAKRSGRDCYQFANPSLASKTS